MGFTLEDLGVAYKKAKVDMYYSSHASLLLLAEYEAQLFNNLQSLLERLNGDNLDWISGDVFLGSWILAPKSISLPGSSETGGGVIFSSPEEDWNQMFHDEESEDSSKKIIAEFRLMAHTSIDFHVISALWMLHVGHLYDAELSECAYGNRLRRKQNGNINPLSLGSISPYLEPFRAWRDNGIKAMRVALDSGKKIVALTADVNAFYHELNPEFMIDKKFNALFRFKLSSNQEKLHTLFICALHCWAKKTPLGKGLPVGLPASAVVANVALIELDRLIEEKIAPLYYGRYVDDILLVMENGAGFQSIAEVWQWIFNHSEEKLHWLDDQKKEVRFCPDYLRDSKIGFSNKKNKVFILSGESGKTLVDSIAHQIYERASEWRSLPNLPRSANHVATDLVAATQSDGEAADNLRKADALTMRRASFAIKLRDFEAYERDLSPEAWESHRHAFLRAFVEHVLVLPHFFELALYLPRVVRLATACGDFEHLRRIIEALRRISRNVERYCIANIKSCSPETLPDSSTLIERWNRELFKSVHESIIAAFPPRLSKEGKAAWNLHMAELQSTLDSDLGKLNIESIQVGQAWLFSYDLAHMPFRAIGLPKEMITQRGVPHKKRVLLLKSINALLPASITDGVNTLARWIKFNEEPPHGLVFATRPFNLSELFVLAKDPFSETSRPALQAVVLALRGYSLKRSLPIFDHKGILQIPDEDIREKYSIAVSSWKTRHDSWVASVTCSSDPDVDRYARLTRLVNSVISRPRGIRYFILPELALPAHWFIRIAQKLQGRGISLITGVQYLHGRGRVRNQVWTALSHDGLGFPSMMIYRQDKQRPALHEEQELHRIAGIEMTPDITWKSPPILQHGNFRFAMLVCSELTNIGYRAALRGKIDALFVPEWNQDTETYNALVESAALDVHTYVIQCNDRQYGDSRIRVPHKDNWRRDVLRVKGGVDDYCVTGEIDVKALRQFQSNHRSPSGPFKPVPDGFKIASGRKILPL